MNGQQYYNNLEARANDVKAKVRSGEGILPHELAVLHELASYSGRQTDLMSYVNAKGALKKEDGVINTKGDGSQTDAKSQDGQGSEDKTEEQLQTEKMQAKADQDREAALNAARSKIKEAKAKAMRTSNVNDQLKYINLKQQLSDHKNNKDNYKN